MIDFGRREIQSRKTHMNNIRNDELKLMKKDMTSFVKKKYRSSVFMTIAENERS